MEFRPTAQNEAEGQLRSSLGVIYWTIMFRQYHEACRWRVRVSTGSALRIEAEGEQVSEPVAKYAAENYLGILLRTLGVQDSELPR